MNIFRKAIVSDVDAIAQLVNSAYRGEYSRAGWTTEADLLDGLRTSADEIQQLIAAESAIILLCLNNTALMGSICIEKAQDTAHIGMFVVNPTSQGQGIGKQLLAAAENLAQQTWAVQTYQMHVITLRHELIAFYERRGYQRTGILTEFPINDAVWQAKRAGLQLEVLEKSSGNQSDG
jgi:ribosomal protein S18 acetylase RimI-like enzyme